MLVSSLVQFEILPSQGIPEEMSYFSYKPTYVTTRIVNYCRATTLLPDHVITFNLGLTHLIMTYKA